MAREGINTGDKVPVSDFNMTNTTAVGGNHAINVQGHVVIVPRWRYIDLLRLWYERKGVQVNFCACMMVCAHHWHPYLCLCVIVCVYVVMHAFCLLVVHTDYLSVRSHVLW